MGISSALPQRLTRPGMSSRSRILSPQSLPEPPENKRSLAPVGFAWRLLGRHHDDVYSCRGWVEALRRDCAAAETTDAHCRRRAKQAGKVAAPKGKANGS